MKLTREGLKEKEAWRAKGYRIPEYDLEKVVKETKENPCWLHFGAGNIFKAFQANVVQNLLNEGVLDRGIIAVGNAESIEKVNRPHDELNILMTLKADGTMEKTVVGSVVESCILDAENVPEYDRLKEIFTKDSLQMISFTVTEKAYSLVDAAGEFLPAIAEDFEKGPEKPKSYMGKVAALLYHRYKNGEKPLAVVSMDNCSHNSDILHNTINTFAVKWAEKGFTGKVAVAVYVEPIQARTLEVPEENISLINSPVGFVVSLPEDVESYELEISGLAEHVDAAFAKQAFDAVGHGEYDIDPHHVENEGEGNIDSCKLGT